MNTSTRTLPELPLADWEQSKISLHLFMQIVGKIRLAIMPRKNQWWNITLYVSTTGFTTRAIPCHEGLESFEIIFNIIEHRLEVMTTRGEHESFALQDGLSVAAFHDQLFAILDKLGIEVDILAKPFDIPGIETPFAEDSVHASYQADFVTRFWQIMRWVDGVFNEFSGRSYAKTCPVHLYWHHMDLAVTRFSGNKGPDMDPATRISDKEAYSHEVISFGFWAGDEHVPGAAFYAYTYPSPAGIDQQKLAPAAASWVDNNGSPMALLMYDDLLQSDDPRQALLDFLESSYQAGASLAGWDIAGLTVPPLAEL